MSEKIVLEDIKPYEHLFTSVPAFLLERMAKRKSNLVKKFESPVRSRLNSLNEHQRNKLHVVLNSEIREAMIQNWTNPPGMDGKRNAAAQDSTTNDTDIIRL